MNLFFNIVIMSDELINNIKNKWTDKTLYYEYDNLYKLRLKCGGTEIHITKYDINGSNKIWSKKLYIEHYVQFIKFTHQKHIIIVFRKNNDEALLIQFYDQDCKFLFKFNIIFEHNISLTYYSIISHNDHIILIYNNSQKDYSPAKLRIYSYDGSLLYFEDLSKYYFGNENSSLVILYYTIINKISDNIQDNIQPNIEKLCDITNVNISKINIINNNSNIYVAASKINNDHYYIDIANSVIYYYNYENKLKIQHIKSDIVLEHSKCKYIIIYNTLIITNNKNFITITLEY